jgi:tetrapyrrole methylase family protein/MazG family protein
VYPAVSFVDLASASLGQDLGSLQICDATALRIDTWRPALIHQVYDRDLVSELKLQLLEFYPADHRLTLLHNLGAPDEQISPVSLSELDRRAYGYLDTLFIPALDPLDDLRRMDGLVEVVRRLHAPGGCPWDREQTHASLRPHLLEESYEALEAIDAGDAAALTEELGDVLLQVLMHAEVGARDGTFQLADVVEHIARKLIRRHPHVFGDATASSAEEVYQNWEQLKKTEKTRESILEGVPSTLPALAASQSIQGRARRVGFDWPDIEGPLEKLREEIGEFARAATAPEREDEFGDILFVLVNIADHLGIDAEQALRGANAKFRRRFGAVEQLAAARGQDLKQLDLAGLDALWDEAKASLS